MALTRGASDAAPITARTLDKAVERGILTRLQVAELKELAGLTALPVPPAASDRAEEGPRDPENLRFIGGFADVFVTIGLLLFLGALVQMLGGIAAGGLGMAAGAAAAWALAEYFTRRRRMALPSIVLLVAFVGGVFGAVVQLPGLVPDRVLGDLGWLAPLQGYALVDEGGIVVLAGTAGALAAALHYWRFRVPITVAAGVASLCAGLATAIGALRPGCL